MAYDLSSTRERFFERFRDDAAAYFADYPDVHSIVFSVIEGSIDGTRNDSVDQLVTPYPTAEPSFPHDCESIYGPSEGHCCPHWAQYGEPNDESVYAWSAFCPDGRSQSLAYDKRWCPVAIARRSAIGANLEYVGRIVRPWLDRSDVVVKKTPRSWPRSEEAMPEPSALSWSSVERAMFEAIWEDPSSDARREVLIDWWLERGDERGRYGELSLRRALSDSDRRTLRTIEARSGRRWLGPLRRFISCGAAEFARGPFVSRATVYLDADEDTEALENVEEWATVESLELVGPRQGFSQHMRSLKEVIGLQAAGVASLVRTQLSARLDTVGFAEPVDGVPWQDCACLSSARRLIIEHETPEAFGGMPFGSQLSEVEFWLTPTFYTQFPWADDRVRTTLQLFLPRLPAGTTLRVGYSLSNKLHSGVTAVARGGDQAIQLEVGKYSWPFELSYARETCVNLGLQLK